MKQAEGFWKLQEEGVGDADIARLMGCSERLVKEYLKVLNEGEGELQEAVLKSASEGGVPVRAAAQAVDLPADVQKDLAESMAGDTTEEAMDKVHEAQADQPDAAPPKKKKGSPKNAGGAKPYTFGRDGRKRHKMCCDLVKAGLMKDPKDAVLLGQLDILNIIAGNKEIGEVFKP